jgi:hypothetical protein
MKEKELARFVYENKEYVVGIDIYVYDNIKFAVPWFFITINSSKKNRKVNDKRDAHHLRIKFSNPYPLFIKIFKIYEEFLKDFDYVLFCPYRDDKEKRINTYSKSLNKMGFELQKKDWKENIFFFKRSNAKILKRKYLNNMFLEMHDYL